ncbi:MAG: hypothetical protein L0Z07_00930, partial [Planctomycetes bacterium]|nr:hypothetical protein [Planctomycetota bacterium]
MVRRILHSLMALGVLVVAYQAYVLLAVPWLEPPLQVRENQRAIPADRAGANPATKYQRLLANYFPHGHWSQLRPPVVISTGAVMLVLDNYDRGEEGRVDIERCALLVFPTAYQEGVAPPQDAVVVEASQGARLQFDEGFRPERGQIGQITRGEFPGKVTIRSGMQSLGPEDDLLIETSDLMMNTKLLYTASPVRFRLGSNVGGGRELEIRFLEEEHSRPGKSGLKIAGISSLEMRRDVRLRLYLETDSLLPGEDQSRHRDNEDERIRRLPDAAAIAAAEPSQGPSLGGKGIATAAPSKPPVEVTCSGPFHFDFTRYVASFDRDVELRQILPDGPSDQLTAQQLDIHFAPRQEPGSQPASPVVDPAQRQKQDLGRLEPSVVVAQGYPVVVISPSRGAEARGERIQLGLRDQQVILNGGRDVRLA